MVLIQGFEAVSAQTPQNILFAADTNLFVLRLLVPVLLRRRIHIALDLLLRNFSWFPNMGYRRFEKSHVISVLETDRKIFQGNMMKWKINSKLIFLKVIKNKIQHFIQSVIDYPLNIKFFPFLSKAAFKNSPFQSLSVHRSRSFTGIIWVSAYRLYLFLGVGFSSSSDSSFADSSSCSSSSSRNSSTSLF